MENRTSEKSLKENNKHKQFSRFVLLSGYLVNRCCEWNSSTLSFAQNVDNASAILRNLAGTNTERVTENVKSLPVIPKLSQTMEPLAVIPQTQTEIQTDQFSP
eukprot:c7435_g1_i1.p2 GENE.c7435_g1_i1~~c7435_g1_i1.p2  ORF type:complete len:116 (-),score=21.85 c7435_g1_i1:1073-1381(-)